MTAPLIRHFSADDETYLRDLKQRGKKKEKWRWKPSENHSIHWPNDCDVKSAGIDLSMLPSGAALFLAGRHQLTSMMDFKAYRTEGVFFTFDKSLKTLNLVTINSEAAEEIYCRCKAFSGAPHFFSIPLFPNNIILP